MRANIALLYCFFYCCQNIQTCRTCCNLHVTRCMHFVSVYVFLLLQFVNNFFTQSSLIKVVITLCYYIKASELVDVFQQPACGYDMVFCKLTPRMWVSVTLQRYYTLRLFPAITVALSIGW